MGKLDRVCAAPAVEDIQALHDAVAPFDAEAAALLVRVLRRKAAVARCNKIYEANVLADLHDDRTSRRTLWTFLDTAHNATDRRLRARVLRGVRCARSRLITDEAFRSAAGRRSAKAAGDHDRVDRHRRHGRRIRRWARGRLGGGRSAASIIGAGVGGFGAGVGGHLAGDVFRSAPQRQAGLRSVGAYMKSGARRSDGHRARGISVGAGKYLGEGGTPTRGDR